MDSQDAAGASAPAVATDAAAAGDTSPTKPADIPQQIQKQTDTLPTSTPVEMNSLQASTPSPLSERPQVDDPSTADGRQPNQLDSAVASGADVASDRPAALRSRKESSAIGPDTDSPIIPVDSSAGPTVMITLLLVSGARHPYKIDEPYLRKRNVASSADTSIDPFTISVYTMKELIWRDWRQEWESRPSSPSSIRLIHFGKLLDDKSTLQDYFKPDTPNVVHMSVKPQDFGDDDDNAKAGHHSQRDDGDAGVGCGCRCVIL